MLSQIVQIFSEEYSLLGVCACVCGRGLIIGEVITWFRGLGLGVAGQEIGGLFRGSDNQDSYVIGGVKGGP